MDIIFLIVAGITMGLSAGILGIGGGVIAVPILVYFFKDTSIVQQENQYMYFAIGTSLATMILVSASSAYSHFKHKLIDIESFKKLITLAILGNVLGVVLSNFLSSKILIIFYIILCLFLLLKMILPKNNKKKSDLNIKNSYMVAGTLAGLQGGLLGGGGGVVVVPSLSNMGIAIQKAKGTAALLAFPMALFGTAGYMIMGYLHHPIVHSDFISGYIYWTAVVIMGVFGVIFAPIGVLIGKNMPPIYIKLLFILLLVFLCIKMTLIMV